MKVTVTIATTELYNEFNSFVQNQINRFSDNEKINVTLGNYLDPETSDNKTIIYDIDYNSIVPFFIFNKKEGIHRTTELQKSDNFVIKIVTDSIYMTHEIAEQIYHQLRGIKDYVDNSILLNYDNNTVVVAIGAETDYYPEMVFVPADYINII